MMSRKLFIKELVYLLNESSKEKKELTIIYKKQRDIILDRIKDSYTLESIFYELEDKIDKKINNINRINKDINAVIKRFLYSGNNSFKKEFRIAESRDRKIDGVSIDNIRRVTRDLYGEVLPKFCELCGYSNMNLLDIHHKRYSFPIKREDVMRVCKSCHAIIEGRSKQTHPHISNGEF